MDYDQEVAEKLKKKKIKSSYRTSGGSSGSGSSLTSWKNITNRIHEMEDEMRRFNEEKVHELLNSLELDKYKNFRKKKNKVVISPSNTLVENPDEEDSGTFIFRGTTKDESDSDEDQGTFVFKGTIKNSGDSGDEGTIVQRKEEALSNGKTSSTGQNLKEDIVAATLLNRREVLNEEKKELSGDDLKHLLKKNPKDAAKQIVQGLKKSLSYDEQNTQEPEQTTVEKSHVINFYFIHIVIHSK